MKTPMEQVEEFHTAFDVPVQVWPTLPSRETREFRKNLLREEYWEYVNAEIKDDIVNIAEELADIIYIVCGTALTYGIDLDNVFAEIHAANMAKLQPDGTVLRRGDGKVLKPAGWQKADIKSAMGM